MKKIRLILDSDAGSVGYELDLEAGKYNCGKFDCSNQQLQTMTDIEETGEILDPAILAKKLYFVIKIALEEPKTMSPEVNQQV